MKHILISLLFIFSSLFCIGQIDILWDDDPGVIYNGQTINIVKDYAGFDVYMHCQNNTGSVVDINFRRVILSNNDSIFSDQFCDNNLCYSCFGSDWTTPALNPLQNGDSCLMKPTFYFSNGGNVHIRYYILDINDNPIDSVDVNITNTVGIEESNNPISVYPNPINSFLNINLTPNSYNAVNLKIYDLKGKDILNLNLKSDLNSIKLNGLNSGIYLYKIYNEDNLLKKGKFIKK